MALEPILNLEHIVALAYHFLQELFSLPGEEVTFVNWHLSTHAALLLELHLDCLSLSFCGWVWRDASIAEEVQHLAWNFFQSLFS